MHSEQPLKWFPRSDKNIFILSLVESKNSTAEYQQHGRKALSTFLGYHLCFFHYKGCECQGYVPIGFIQESHVLWFKRVCNLCRLSFLLSASLSLIVDQRC